MIDKFTASLRLVLFARPYPLSLCIGLPVSVKDTIHQQERKHAELG